MKQKTTSTCLHWFTRLTNWIPRTADDWKWLGITIGMILLLAALLGTPIVIGILKLWALCKYVFS